MKAAMQGAEQLQREVFPAGAGGAVAWQNVGDRQGADDGGLQGRRHPDPGGDDRD